MDAKQVINGGVMKIQNGKKIEVPKWDLIIAHPPCTYLSHVNTRGHSIKSTPVNWIIGRTENRIDAMRFFMLMVEANCDKIAVENPVGVMNTCYRQPDQIIEPYMFSGGKDDTENYVTKRTCLWLKGLKQLEGWCDERPNNAELFGKYKSGKNRTWEDSTTRDAAVRSKTFPGIAKAMAEQWG